MKTFAKNFKNRLHNGNKWCIINLWSEYLFFLIEIVSAYKQTFAPYIQGIRQQTIS